MSKAGRPVGLYKLPSDTNAEDVVGGDNGKSAGNQFFRVPRPPSKLKPSFLTDKRTKSTSGRGHGELKVKLGETTGVELALLLAESHAPKNDEMHHQIYYFLESDPPNVIQRNPYEGGLHGKGCASVLHHYPNWGDRIQQEERD